MTHHRLSGPHGLAARPLAAAFTAIAIWGATPAVTLIATQHMAAADVGKLRTVLSAAVLLALAALWRLRLPHDRAGWLDLAISAVAGFVAYPLLLSIAIPMTTTAHAALILAAPPVLTGLIGFGLSRRRPPPLWLAGAAIALAGEALLIFGRGLSSSSRATMTGDLLIALSVIVVSIGYVTGGRLANRIGTWAATSWAVIVGGLLLAPFSISAVTNLASVGWPGLSAIAFLVFGVTIIGYACWYFAIGTAGPQRVAPLQFSQPLFSLVIAMAFLNEQMSLTLLTATALILAGVVLCRKALS